MTVCNDVLVTMFILHCLCGRILCLKPSGVHEASGTVSFKILGEEMNQTYFGVVMATITETSIRAISGLVCGGDVSLSTKEYICNSLGFSIANAVLSNTVSATHDYRYSQDIIIDSLKCSSSTNKCTFNENVNCGHEDVLFLDCSCQSSSYRTSTGCVTCEKGVADEDREYCICQDENYYFSRIVRQCRRCPGDYTSQMQYFPYECNCGQGKHWDDETEQCVPCPYMMYSARTTRGCRHCPEMATSTTSSKDKCICPPRYGWVDQLGDCQLCGENYFSVGSELACIKCPQDSFSDEGSTSCTCHDGSVWVLDKCEMCPANSFSYSGDTRCTTCSTGATSDQGSNSCTCPSGKFWDGNGRRCISCPVGTYSTGAVKECTPCPSGFTSNMGMDHCLCTVGRFWSDTDRTCMECPKAKYSDMVGALSCRSCPDRSTSLPGSDVCTCEQGYVWNRELHTCEECHEGTYFIDSSVPCHPCPHGTVSSDGMACFCPDGEYWDAGACKSCPAGQYKSVRDTACLPCPSAASSLQGSARCNCNRGSYWNTTSELCIECPINTYSDANSTRCTPCPPGSSTTANSWACTCNGGHIWSGLECLMCPEGTYSDTDECLPCGTNKISVPGSTECICPAGHTVTEDGSCEICPPNHYSATDNSRECASCPDTSSSAEGATGCSCDFGLIWRSENCQPCSQGFYDNGADECVRCPLYQTSTSGSDRCRGCSYDEYWDNYECKKCEGRSIGNGITCIPCPANLTKVDNFCVSNFNHAYQEVQKNIDLLVNVKIDTLLKERFQDLADQLQQQQEEQDQIEGVGKTTNSKSSSGTTYVNTIAGSQKSTGDEISTQEKSFIGEFDSLHIVMVACTCVFGCLVLILMAIVCRDKKHHTIRVEEALPPPQPIIEIEDAEQEDGLLDDIEADGNEVINLNGTGGEYNVVNTRSGNIKYKASSYSQS